ncbi:ribosome-associated toxin RatA of RatAB toxin-antitoxin module [Oxalobacteraceae bacterium GrIS 1.11]
MKILFLPALLLCGAVQADMPPGIDMANLSESSIAMSDVSKPGASGKSFVAATIINAPLPRLCALIQDFANYPSFMPGVDQTRVTRAADDASLVDMTLKLPLGKVKKYRLKMEARSSTQLCHLAWKMVPSEGLKQEETIADTTGYWQLTPAPADKNKSVVKYFVYTDPGPVPLGMGWIVDSLSKDSLPKTLEALRGKAAQR